MNHASMSTSPAAISTSTNSTKRGNIMLHRPGARPLQRGRHVEGTIQTVRQVWAVTQPPLHRVLRLNDDAPVGIKGVLHAGQLGGQVGRQQRVCTKDWLVFLQPQLGLTPKKIPHFAAL